MSLHFFFVPAARPATAQDELNAFLTRERVLTITRDFVADGAASGWAICVELTPGAAPLPAELRANAGRPRAETVDYKQLLSPDDFEVFAALRDWRKKTAQAEGLPVYAVFSNEQLAQIVTRQVAMLDDLAAIDGVGPARVQKYGEVALACAQARRATLAAGPAP